MQYMNFTFTKSKFCSRNLKMVAKFSSKTWQMPCFPNLSMYLVMQYMNFMFFDMSMFKFWEVQNLNFATKNLKIFKMAAIFKMVTKISAKRHRICHNFLTFQYILPRITWGCLFASLKLISGKFNVAVTSKNGCQNGLQDKYHNFLFLMHLE